MNRRDFLKLGGIATLVLALPVWKLAEHVLTFPMVEFNGIFFRGTPTGEIQISKDQKQTWQKQVYFGQDFAIQNFSIQPDELTAKVDYQGWDFYLTFSEETNNWLVT
jgi:hypothetical protein